MTVTVPVSPFLENTHVQYAWDSTSLGYLKTCPRLYQYQMILGYQPKEENIHLRFGLEYHTSLEQYDKLKVKGYHRDDALREVVLDLLKRTYGWKVDESQKPGLYKNRRNLVRMVIDYVDRFDGGLHGDNCKTLILADGTPAVELSFRFELPWGPSGANMPYMLCGHIDRMVTFNDEPFGSDRKTSTTTLSDYYFNGFEPNNQMSLYSTAMRVVFQTPVKGMIIDAGQIMVDSTEFQRAMTFRTEGQLEEWMKDLQFWLAQAEAYAKAEYWPQNDTSCDKYGGCRFRGVCNKDPRVRQHSLRTKYNQLPMEERWNPLKPR